VTTLTFTDLSPIVPYDSIGRFGQTFLVSWTDWGGNPLVVIAIVALLAFAWQTPRSHASRPPLPPPHVDARAAVGEHQEVAG